MRKSKTYSILSLAISTVLFSGLTQAASVSWNKFDLKLNNLGTGIDSKGKRVFVPLGAGFEKAKAYDVALNYNFSNANTFALGGIKVKNGDTYHFSSIKYGATQPVSLYDAQGKLIDTYTLIFTNLPVIQVTSVTAIPDTPKVQGSFRLISGEFNQDTGALSMGVDLHGQTSQDYAKKSLNIKLGTSAQQWKIAKKTKLLDLRSNDDWILDASYQDPTFARNRICHDIFREIHPSNIGSPKEQTAIRGHLAEVIENGSYMGVFVLNEKVGHGMLDLSATNSALYKADLGDTVFFTTKGLDANFSQSYPSVKTVKTWKPLLDFVGFVSKSSDTAFVAGIRDRVDLNSLADWWLLVSATQGTDNINKNFFLANSAGGKFFMVPWDHNATFGMFWDGSVETMDPDIAPTVNNLFMRLVKLPATGFNALLKSRWAELRSTTFTRAKLLARFSKYEVQLTQGGAKARNRTLWPKTTLPPVIGDLKIGTQAYIGQFLNDRLPAVDDYINSLPE